jgi:hypothetical protein
MMQQKRIVTIQECARAQGFPDHYQFLSVNKELSKIVQDVCQCLNTRSYIRVNLHCGFILLSNNVRSGTQYQYHLRWLSGNLLGKSYSRLGKKKTGQAAPRFESNS